MRVYDEPQHQPQEDVPILMKAFFFFVMGFLAAAAGFYGLNVWSSFAAAGVLLLATPERDTVAAAIGRWLLRLLAGTFATVGAFVLLGGTPSAEWIGMWGVVAILVVTAGEVVVFAVDQAAGRVGDSA